MALSASSSCTKTVVAVAEAPKVTTRSEGKAAQAGGVLPLPVKPKFQSSALQRTKSRKPVKKGTAVSATLQEAVVTTSPAVEEESVSVPAGEVLEEEDAATEVVAAPGGAMRVRKSAGKANSRTSRRRALVMCLALGMVRPCASNVESNNSQQVTADLRRTASAMPALRRTASSSFKATGSALVSQVSLATTMKQTNLLGEPEDLQKLTSLQ